MSEWKLKRFWKSATAAPCDGGFEVLLDGRRVKTPAKSPLILPSLALAEAIAAEWDAQDDAVDPGQMPLTRTANSAIDKVAHQFEDVAAMLAEYGGTDLLCYRAEAPVGLQAAQAAAWDPLLDWARVRYDAPLMTGQGVMHVMQPQASLDNLAAPLRAMSVFELAGFHDLVTISGSLIIALALAEAQIDLDTAWAAAHVDEDWQAQEWGHDDEATAHAALKQAAFGDALAFLRLSGKKS